MRPALLGLLLAGCTMGPGTGFVHLERVELEAGLEVSPARDLGDGWILTDQGWRVRPSLLELVVDGVALESLEGGGAGGSFDPANPPEGYGLCHGGHCHADDGRLVDYVEVEAELAGGARFVEVARVEGAAIADLLRGGTVGWPRVDPQDDLPAVTVRRAGLGQVELVVQAEAEELESGELVVVTGAVALTPRTEGFDWEIGRGGPDAVRVVLGLWPGAELFDGLAFGELAVDGVVELSDPAGVGGAALVEGLLLSELEIDVEEVR